MHMNTNQEFMQSFNNIEKNLRLSINAYQNAPFYELLEKNSRKNKLVKQFSAELRTMGDLRNFIVHGDIGNPLAIASDNTVQRIKQIEKELINPMKIRELFSKNVIGVKEDNSLVSVLDIIKEKKYSQFPVLSEDGFKGLITENGITNWLANNIEEAITSIRDTTIKDVLEEEEEQESYSILYSQDTLYDVIEEFEKAAKTGDKTFVVIVINSPKKKFFLEDIYTIITPWDLDIIYKNLGLKI